MSPSSWMPSHLTSAVWASHGLGNRELKPGEKLLFSDLNCHLLLICKNPSSDHQRLFSSCPSPVYAVPCAAAFSSLLRAILLSSSSTCVSPVGRGMGFASGCHLEWNVFKEKYLMWWHRCKYCINMYADSGLIQACLVQVQHFIPHKNESLLVQGKHLEMNLVVLLTFLMTAAVLWQGLASPFRWGKLLGCPSGTSTSDREGSNSYK